LFVRVTTNMKQCPICRAEFANKKSLAQHRASCAGRGQSNTQRKQRPNRRQPAQLVSTVSLDSRAPMTVPNTAKRDLLKYRLNEENLATDTEYGKSYLSMYLHPMGESLRRGVHVPDESPTDSVALMGRWAVNILPPSGLTSGDTWNADLVVMAFPELGLAYRAYKSGTTPGDFIGVPVTSFPTGWVASDGQTKLDPQLAALTETFRSVFKGITVDLQAADLNNAGTVWAGQLASKPLYESGGIVPSVGYTVPLDEDSLVQQIAGFYQAEAKNGVYLPLKYVDPRIPYSTPLEVGETKPADGEPAIPTYPAIALIEGGATTTELLVRLSSDNTKYLTATGSDLMQTGVILFRGMYPGASLQARGKTGLEAVPNVGSSWSPFLESTAMFDPTALKTAARVAQVLPLAYPADYNSLGKIWNVIRSALQKVVPWVGTVGKIAGSLGVPLVSPIGQGIGQAADLVGGWLG